MTIDISPRDDQAAEGKPAAPTGYGNGLTGSHCCQVTGVCAPTSAQLAGTGRSIRHRARPQNMFTISQPYSAVGPRPIKACSACFGVLWPSSSATTALLMGISTPSWAALWTTVRAL